MPALSPRVSTFPARRTRNPPQPRLASIVHLDPASRPRSRRCHEERYAEVLLTSHSPFIISDCRKENVLVFNKNPETQTVNWQRPDFETFGASANAITIKVFNRKETIGNYALSKLDGLRQRLNNGESPDQLIDEAGQELGDSVEKVLFINQALNKKEGK